MTLTQILSKLKSLVYSKTETDTLLGNKAASSHTHTKSQITDFPAYGSTAGTICQGNDARLSDARTPTSHTHTKSQITDFPSLATVATSGSYNDLSNKPTIPTVNNKTLTIQKNGTTVNTFTANSSTDITANITVPTKTSQLTNDSGFLTTHQSLSNYSTLANTVKSLSISGKTITVTPGSGNAYTLTTQDTNTTYSNFVKSGSGAKAGLVPAPSTTAGTTKYLREDGTWQVPPDHTYTVNNATLTIQKNGTTVKTFTANASANVTANITVPTKTSELTNDSGFLTSHQSLSGILPIGSYIQFAGSQAPAGFLVCNGGAISRTTYSKLFAVIGTTYGSGDGSTTFNLPNLTDRFLQGSTTSGAIKEAGLPNIKGQAAGMIDTYMELSPKSGVFSGSIYGAMIHAEVHQDEDKNDWEYILDLNASKSNSIYGNSTTVQPPALTCLICIKY